MSKLDKTAFHATQLHGTSGRSRGRHSQGGFTEIMDWDDLKPKPPKGVMLGESLETLSVGELEARIVALRQEIERVGRELAAKKAHEAAAAAIFKR